MKHRRGFILSIVILLLIGGIVGCQLPTEEQTETGNTGTLTVVLADDPFPAEFVAEANVTIDSVVIREKDESDEGDPFHTLTTEQKSYNLLDLQNGVTETLAEVEVPVGSFDLVRLYVSEASITLTNDDVFNLTVPSGAETGIQVLIEPDIVVKGGLTTELLLDFNVSKSFVALGNLDSPAGISGFNFKPVIRAANLTTSGRISGTVTDSEENVLEDVEVWTVVDEDTTTALTGEEGEYALIGLPAGSYTVKAAMDEDTITTEDVEVVAGNETILDIQWTDGTGKLTVLMTDAPFPIDTVATAMVTIDSIDIRKAGETGDTSYVTISTESGTYNLLDLRNGVTATLADLSVPEGDYDLIRLFISEAGIELKNGNTHDLKVPSGVKTGLKLFIEPDISVQNGLTAELLLDFDVSNSFVARGSFHSPHDFKGFIFKPVLRVVNQSTAGRIVGTISDTSGSVMPDIEVWAEVDEDTVTTTFTGDEGEYVLPGLPADIYQLMVYSTEYDTAITVSEEVQVTAGTATKVDYQFILE